MLWIGEAEGDNQSDLRRQGIIASDLVKYEYGSRQKSRENNRVAKKSMLKH